MVGVEDVGDFAVEGRVDHAFAGINAHAVAEDAGGEGVVGDALAGNDLAGDGLDHVRAGNADHGGGGNGLGRSRRRLLLRLLFLPEHEGQGEGHAAGDQHLNRVHGDVVDDQQAGNAGDAVGRRAEGLGRAVHIDLNQGAEEGGNRAADDRRDEGLHEAEVDAEDGGLGNAQGSGEGGGQG